MFFLAVDSASIFIVLLTIFKNSTSILVGIVLTTNKTGNKIHSFCSNKFLGLVGNKERLLAARG
eukprot:m.256931 g.256931  ORF g.256931 m.256931 type:complete len:64 (+) comp40404_c0_seq55:776-967(+)